MTAGYARGGENTPAAAEAPASNQAAEENPSPADILSSNIAQALRILEDDPENPATLDQLASLYVQKSNFREAGMIYTRRLKLVLDDPAAALPYVVLKWRLRQDYEAQAAMIRGLAVEELPPGGVKLLQGALDEIYNPQSLIDVLKPEFAKPEELPMLEEIEKYWLGVYEKILEKERERKLADLQSYADGLFVGKPEAAACLALWRCFALAYKQDLVGAELQLRIALGEKDNLHLQMDAAAASVLIREVNPDSLSSDILDRFSELVSEISDAASKQFSGSHVNVYDLFEKAKQANEARKFADALPILDSARPLLTDVKRRLYYIFLHANALWGVGEYARANQGYVASSVFQKERYAASESLFRMAQYASMNNDRDLAADYAARSAGIMRESPWRLRQVGSFFVSLDMSERGIAYLERSLEASTTLMSDADSYAELATAYKRIGKRDRYLEYARSYVETIDQIVLNGDKITPDQEGLRHYLMGEILASEEKHQEAYKSYELASELIKERYRLAETLMVMAEYQATAQNAEKAEDLAVRSGDLLPTQPWKLRQVGNLLLRVGIRGKAIRYYEKALEYSFSVQNRTLSYAALTDAYRSWRDWDMAYHYAREYIALVKMHRDRLTDAEEGLAAFYQGEIHAYNGESALAYAEYERAANLLTNRFTRAEVYMKMAEYQASIGAHELAATLAGKSAADVPDQAWKLRQVGNFFLRLAMVEKAREYFDRYVKMAAPEDRLAVYAVIADAYKSMRHGEHYAEAAQAYIDMASADGRVPTRAEEGMVAYFEGEIHRIRGEKDKANAAYEKASGLLTENERLAEVYMNLARYQAELGDPDAAANLAVRSAEVLSNAENLQKVGEFLMSLGMGEKAFVYFERFAEETADRRGKAGVYLTMAGWYQKQGEMANFLEYAQRYVDLTSSEGYAPNRTERGLSAYYRGEIAAAKGRADEAYDAYRQAVDFISDRARLAEIYLKMARIEAGRGNQTNAAALAERAAEALPYETRTLMQVSDFLLSLGMRDKALAYLERYLGQTTGKGNRYSAYAFWAESQKKAGDRKMYLYYIGEMIDAFNADPGPHSPADEGLVLYYTAELRESEGEDDEAYRLYEKASTLIEDKNRLLDVYMKMAEHQARKGDKEAAARLAGQAAEAMPNNAGVVMRIGDFLVGLGMPDEAYRYYMRYVELNATPGGRLFAWSKLADAYNNLRDREKYREYAEKYVLDADQTGGLTRAQGGLAEFYRGEVAVIDGKPDDAYTAFEKASQLITEKYRLAETLMKMASIEEQRGNRDEAAQLAERSLAQLPDANWKIRQVVDMLIRLGMPERAIAIYERRLELAKTPRETAEIYSQLAGIYRKLGDQDKYLYYTGEYVKIVSAADFVPTPYESGLRYFYLGEYYLARMQPSDALAAYEEASKLITDKYQLAEIYMKMAELEFERGENARAAELTELSLALLPDEDWKVQEAAEMFIRLNMPDKAFKAFEDRLSRIDAPQRRAGVYLRLAELYRKVGDTDKFVETLEQYFALTAPEEESLNQARRGEYRYYRGEYYRALNQDAEAYIEYEMASELVTEKYRLAEILMHMAEIEARGGNNEQAALLAERSLEQLPDAEWKNRQVAEFIRRLGMRERSTELYERRLTLADTPAKKAAAYAGLANIHRDLGNDDEFIRYAEEYIALVTSDEYDAKPEELAESRLYRGEILRRKKEWDEAVAAYESALPLIADKRRSAGIVMTMAAIRAEQGDDNAAGDMVDRAVALAPEDGKVLMDAASLLNRLGMKDKAVSYYERRVALAEAPADKAALYATIANSYRGSRVDRAEFIRFAREYVALTRSGAVPPGRDSLALAHLYQAEIHMDEGDHAAAVRELEQAYEAFAGKDRKFETLLLLARSHARLDHKDEAVRYAELAAELFPDNPWRQREVGDFFFNFGDMEKSLFYHERFLAKARNDKERAMAYSSFAEIYRRTRDNEKYLEYARRYIAAVSLLGDKATDYEKGYQAFYQGEALLAEKRPDEAYAAFERALMYIKEPYRQSEILVKMADHQVKLLNYPLAGTLAQASADLVPANYWRVLEASQILSRIKYHHQAIEMMHRAIELDPEANARLYRNLSSTYYRIGKRKEAVELSKAYIDYLYEDIEGLPDGDLYRDKYLTLWDARRNHARLTRLLPKMSWETTFFGREYTNDDNHSYGLYSELARYFWFNRRLNGKVYAIYEATTDGFYNGFYTDRYGQKRPWESQHKLGDTDRLIVGVGINPFVHPLLRDLSFKAERVFGIGREADDDYRFHINYDRGSDTMPKPFVCRYPYWKIYADIAYSVENRAVTGNANFRRGMAFVSPWDRNFVIIPYGTVLFNYGGARARKSTRWGSDAGAGIIFKKFLGETRYRTAFESVECGVYFRWGLTHDRYHGYGFAVSLKF